VSPEGKKGEVARGIPRQWAQHPQEQKRDLQNSPKLQYVQGPSKMAGVLAVVTFMITD
jgi:hypothetical protein